MLQELAQRSTPIGEHRQALAEDVLRDDGPLALGSGELGFDLGAQFR
jgi:hypothetical protein